MAKDGTYRGGRRVRAGSKPDALADKIAKGTPARRMELPDFTDDMTDFDIEDIGDGVELEGMDMPSPDDYLSAQQKDGKPLGADEIYRETWLWLKERSCERLVNKRLLESYSEAFARYIQCSEAVSKYGMLGKHPTTGAAIASPFTQLLMNFQKQANLLWYEIYDIVKQNCTEPFEGSPQDDVMERLLRAREEHMNTQKLEQVPIDKLVPYARNARTHSKEQIAQLRASLREFGFVSPAIIDGKYNILVGHGRIQAAREEGYETIPCVFAENLTEAQKRAYILADNQLALNAGWDEEMLSVELSDLQDQSFDLSLLGFEAGELDKLLGIGSGTDIADDDFDLTAALEKASFVEPGDIWTVGRHRMMCGDATSPEDVAKLMDGTKANLVLTDPPYGVSFKASDGLTIQNDSLKGEGVLQVPAGGLQEHGRPPREKAERPTASMRTPKGSPSGRRSSTRASTSPVCASG